MGYLIGIDCGATGTDVILYNRDSGISKITRHKPVNYNLAGFDGTVTQLSSIIKKSARNKLKNTDYIIAGISGAGNADVRRKLKASFRKSLNLKNIEIYPDTEIAFAASFRGDERNCGILIAGTGSVLYHKNNKGIVTKTGGWGRHIGDEGSGFWIARNSLHKVTQYYDGRALKTSLAEKLSIVLKITKHTIIQHIYHNNFEISKITNLVFECAESGDKICKQIIIEAADALSKHFIPLKNEKAKIALCGSLFTRENVLEKYLKKMVKLNYPNIRIVKQETDPVWGAIKIGLNKLRELK